MAKAGVVRSEWHAILRFEHRTAAPSVVIFAARAVGEPLIGRRDAGQLSPMHSRAPIFQTHLRRSVRRVGVEYHPDRCSVALNNFDRVGASLPRRPNGSCDIRLAYRGGAAGHMRYS